VYPYFQKKGGQWMATVNGVQSIQNKLNNLADKIARINKANMVNSGSVQNADFGNYLAQASVTNLSIVQNVSVNKSVTEALKDVGVSSNSEANDYNKISQASANTKAAKALQARNNNTSNDTKITNTDSNTDKNTELNEDMQINEDTKVSQNAEEVTAESTTENTTETITEDIKAVLEDTGKELLTVIADELGVDIDDIEKAMSVLGLNYVSILNPDNMAMLVAQVAGDEGISAIVTNSDLYSSLKSLTDTITTMQHNIMNQLGLSEEQMESAVNTDVNNEDMKEAMGDAQMMANPEAGKETAEGTNEFNAIQLDLIGKNQKFNFNLQVETSNYEMQKTPEIAAPEITVVETQSMGQQSSNLGQGFNMMNGGNQNAMTWNDFLGNIAFNIQNIEAMTEEFTEAVQVAHTSAEDIINQITEYMKISVKPDITSMEMQLHPQSLGSLNVMIETAKDGNIIARFTTADATVKAAIESQLATLQQKFDEQGVKVNAIEVTVQSHAFEQNLEQGNDNQNFANEENQKATKSLRRINLRELTTEDAEELDDSEKLNAEMMEINGGTVDYSA
jgi:flagellar hook-length control protein FliK